MHLIFETLRDTSLFTISIIGSLGLSILYLKIWFISKKIKEINQRIEKHKFELSKKEIKNIKSDHNFDIGFSDNKKQKQEKRKIEQHIERLEREKKYLLEEISIYKIFKK